MFDLKEKLLQAGLVTEGQVEKAKEEEKQAKAKRSAKRQNRPNTKPNKGKKFKGKGGGQKRRKPRKELSFEENERRQWEKRLFKLKKSPKKEIYEVTRNWVERNRLDPVRSLPSEKAERFYFQRPDGSIGSLMLEPEPLQALKSGEAGVVTYMSNHGVSHAVVAKDLALDIGYVVPLWLRFLEGESRAGRVARAVTQRKERQKKLQKRRNIIHGRLASLRMNQLGEVGAMTLVRPGRAGQGFTLLNRKYHVRLRRWLLAHPQHPHHHQIIMHLRSMAQKQRF